MFVVYNCGVLTAEMLPVKPRDATVALIAISFAPLLFCRKQYCTAALALMTLPLLRLADAGFLQRYSIQELETHFAAVIKMAGPVMITGISILTYSSRIGRHWAIISAIGLILAITGSNLYEWMGYAKWSSIPGRMAGFHIHPNTGPTYCLLCLAILYTLNPRFWWNIMLTAVAAIPTALSISRSCCVLYFAVVAVYLALHFREHAKGLIILVCCAPPLIGTWFTIVESRASAGRLRHDEFIEGRFDAILRGDVEGLRSVERGKDLEDGWAAVQRQPVWGYGAGCATGERWQPHNQIVALWLELGVFGALIYVMQLLIPLVLCASQGFRNGWCLLPSFLNIPCLHWLVEMPPYWLALAVCYCALIRQRFEIRVSENAPASARAVAA